MSNATVNFGTCWGTPGGQDVSMPSYMASGFQCVGEAIARRWTTTQGQLVDDPNYGENVLDLINADLTQAQIAYKQQKLGVEAQKDERVLSCSTTLNLSVAGQLTVTGLVDTVAGPFKLVLTVSNVSPAILLVQP